MVNAAVTVTEDPAAAERALALGYAAAAKRAGLAALFELDATLAQVLRTTRDPLLGQMRLTWWYEALRRLDTLPAPAQPLLRTLAAEVLPASVSGSAMAELVTGWEALLDAPLGKAAVRAHAAERGGLLFELAAQLLGTSDPRVGQAGEGWALTDLARHLTDLELVRDASTQAKEHLSNALHGRWPRSLRALAALALLARNDLGVPLGAPVPHGSPTRVFALLRMRLTGY